MTIKPPLIGEILEEGPWLLGDDEAVIDPRTAALADLFKLSMRRLAAGICAVTVRHRGEIFGITATSVTSLSLEPPSLLISVRSTSRLLQVLAKEKAFSVHVLGEAQAYEANAFAGRIGPEPRAALVRWVHDADSPPRLAEATCHIDCRVAKRVPIFSHVVVVGVVERIELGPSDRPLVYFDGAFHALETRRNADARDGSGEGDGG
ncbi:flavin reductase family protein [Rhodoligotrophos defluvii]|uniref:flavin reductase family protein n=1 Tax=Rhodoligotrophos defluvii TaxID=2561934 RepID=UPI0010C9CA99|nr:flavin reductase family protein [Rhodoligotrophos defluvii]